ncbi:unnamed protein product [Linum trigynum]|uniref:ATP-dependent DNA helicase n=1 Tax=Linum trigynum TaxID=586398 RepID=A0AAV2CIQ6_9ROSI
MPRVIRSTFVSMLMFCEIPSPAALFNSSWKSMAEDYAYRLTKDLRDQTQKPTNERLQNWVLHELQAMLSSHSMTIEDFNLPIPCYGSRDDGENPLINEHLAFDTDQQHALATSMLHSLNPEQTNVYTSVINSVLNKMGRAFFLYGHGGTGKTYLYNVITARLRSLGKIVVLVASSGIAATLLPKATNAHSRFKIPLILDAKSTCPIKHGTNLADLLKEASLIIWDEAPMTHRQAFEAVDRSLCDILNVPLNGHHYKPFGGKTVLFGGDFRQTLPVIADAGREQTIDGSLTRSKLWNTFKVMCL